MGRNGSVVVVLLLLLFLILFCRCDGRRILGSDPDPDQDPNVNQDSTLSSPPPDAKKPNSSPAEVTKPKDDPTTNPSNVESKELNDNNKTSSGDKEKPKVENQTQPKTFDSKTCKGNSICKDQEKTMIACIQDFDNGSNNLTLLVQNERDIDLKVNIAFGTSPDTKLPEFKIPGHGTEKINIKFPGDKSNKVILNAGNGDCELQIDQPKTTPVDTPSKSKDPENTVKPKDVNDPVDSPTKPNNVNNSTDNSPVKPKDVDDTSKSKEENDPSKATEVEDPTKPKKSDDPSKSKDVNDPLKSNDVDDSSKSKDVDDPSKSKDQNDPSKSKDINDPSKSKDVDDPSKSKDNNDPSKSKDDTDPSKSKDVNDPSKSKDVDDPSKSNDENTPLPKPTPSNVDTPISQNNILDQLTFYSRQVTPIYGAYFAFLIALIIGASWALCSFRKRRSDNGVPYQELEMALPESSNAADVETAGGWDQDWDDDDWDEDKAIRSPGGRGQTKSISSNGLTSRATKKDGWDADWDD